jgi:hypothetical protein
VATNSKTPARKVAAAPAAAPAAPDAPKVIALKANKDRVEERIALFSIDGTEYTIPSRVRPNQGLQIMHVFRQQGETSGVSFMLETIIGTEGYNALMNFDDLEDEDLETIVEVAFKLVQDSQVSEKTKN